MAREVHITANTTPEIPLAWMAFIPGQEIVYGDSPLECIAKLIHQVAGMPCWLVPLPQPLGSTGLATRVLWRASCQYEYDKSPADITGTDPEVAAMHLLHRLMNGDELEQQAQDA